MIKKIELLCAAACCLLLSSCFSLANSSGAHSIQGGNYELGRKYYLNVDVFQTLSEHKALAWDKDYVVVCVEDDEKVFYDKKRIEGFYTMVDTYTYETTEGREKTVPLFKPYNRKTATQRYSAGRNGSAYDLL